MSTLSIPFIGRAVITGVATSGAGSTYVTFPDQPCTLLDIVNSTGVDLEYRRGGGGSSMPILAGTSRLIGGITNASQIGVRRLDVAVTPVNVPAEAFCS